MNPPVERQDRAGALIVEKALGPEALHEHLVDLLCGVLSIQEAVRVDAVGPARPEAEPVPRETVEDRPDLFGEARILAGIVLKDARGAGVLEHPAQLV